MVTLSDHTVREKYLITMVTPVGKVTSSLSCQYSTYSAASQVPVKLWLAQRPGGQVNVKPFSFSRSPQENQVLFRHSGCAAVQDDADGATMPLVRKTVGRT